MQLGMIGLGRMGGNIVRRLMKHGHSAVVYDRDPKAVAALAGDGAAGSAALEELVNKLEKPRTVWVMLPAGKITEATIDALSKMMQAYAEGFDILKNANIDALPAEHRFDLDIADIAEVWRRGSVIPSWLLDLTASALAKNPTLESYSGFVEDSGEGRWTVNAAIDEAVPAEVLTAALYARFRSRKDHTFAEKILSAMRAGFGGHREPPKNPGSKA